MEKNKNTQTVGAVVEMETPSAQLMANSIDQAANLEEKKRFAEQMIKSGLLPDTLASPDHLLDEEYRDKAIGGVIAIVEYGRELGISPWIALNGMHVVQGKVVVGIHMYMGLALRKGIMVDIVSDYKKIYKGEGKAKKLIDYETVIEITRKYPLLNDLVKTHSFTKRWSEIIKAGLDKRDNYKKRGPLMLRTRATTEALRFYCADLFSGIYETGEQYDSTGNTYDVDESGNVILNN